MTYQELIAQSLTLSGKGYEGQVVSGQTLLTALNKLNSILGEWEAEQLGTWREQYLAFCPTVGKDRYSVSSTGDIAIAQPVDIVEMRTKIVSGAVTYKGETTVAVFLALTSGTEGDYYQFTDSNTDISIGDFGVLNQDVTALITSDDYDLVKDDGVYIPLDEYKQYDYDELPDKYGTGTPLIFHYKPGVDEGEGTLYLWKTAQSGQHIKYTVYRGFPEITTSNVTNNLDFPKSWRRALEYALAYELALFYSAPPDKIALLDAKAFEYLEKSIGSNTTEGGVQFYASDSSH